MVNLTTCRKIALAFEETIEQPHFEKTSFRIRKKIFLTLDASTKIAVVKLSPVEQSVFCAFNADVVYPANGAWGKQGWTRIHLASVNKEFIADAIKASFCNVAPKTLADKYR